MADLTYKIDGMFTRFYPETPVGEAVWAQMAQQTENTGAIFTTQLNSVLRQMKKAGYSVARYRGSEINNDDLLAGLIN